MKRASIQFNVPREAQVVPIVSDAMIGTVALSDGRMVPLVILDTTNRPDIDDVVRAHRHFRNGDSTSLIGFPTRWRHKIVCLGIKFIQPQNCGIYLEFDIVSQGVIVDQIIENELLYIQPGRPGDRLKHNIDAPKVLVEIPFRNFAGVWDVAWREALARDFRKKGVPRRETREAVRDIIAEWREMASKRVGSP
ncbi:MAG: hypothetical protein M3P06_20755 [Acidobacteriota bacterium]|nr:hypothetical protein [Acidobacteriota bacterium]